VDKPKAAIGPKVPAAVSQSIVDLKKENPGFGARRISDILTFRLAGKNAYPIG
jgi:hypothetical protein